MNLQVSKLWRCCVSPYCIHLWSILECPSWYSNRYVVIWIDSDSLNYKTCFDNSAPLPPSLPSILQLATWSNNYNLLYWYALFSIYVALPRGRGGGGAFQEILMSRVFYSLKINFISICVVRNCRLAVILHIKNNLLLFSLQDIPNTNSVITKMWITRLKLVRSLISCKENLGSRSNFQLSVKDNPWLHWFCSSLLLDWPENSHHSLTLLVEFMQVLIGSYRKFPFSWLAAMLTLVLVLQYSIQQHSIS